ncbi:MAG: hypothetical protein EHM35_01020 [Planctomycetaceae bacterium]|nr:MAG: hypothetical protein EHM35_01020 [Planctomycetaceae bacterium]
MAHAPLIVVNPFDRDWKAQRFVLSFGAYADTHLLVWGDLGDALETAGEWLAENAPGHIMAHDSDELKALFKEAANELGMPDDDPGSNLGNGGVYEQATADLTYTESGYLTSHEWLITLNNPTRVQLKAFIAELAERHYDDGPVCDITRPER